jgi:hypothetical protein
MIMKIKITDKRVECPACRVQLGQVYLIGDLEVLKVGDLLVFDVIKGVCVHCSAPFFYSVQLKRFESVVDRLFSEDNDLKTQARQLRRMGKSYGEISRILSIPRVRVWRLFQE